MIDNAAYPASQSPLPDTADLVVLGSGAGGLTAALTGALEGLSCVVLEHEPVFGGTSARSSGTVWVPGNRMIPDPETDREAAERYLSALIDGKGPEKIWRRFLNAAPQMQADLDDRAGIAFRPYPAAPDYRQDKPGAAPGWRPLEPLPFDGRPLGDDFARLAPPLRELMVFGGMMVTRGEAAQLLRADRSLSAAWLGLRLTARFLLDRLNGRRGTRLVLGNALVARLMKAARDAEVGLFSGVETVRLIVADGRVAGVELSNGQRITATRGVVLAGGGYPASPDWRDRELPKPVARHTPAAPGCTGRSIELGLDAGATLGPSGLDNAQWFPSSIMRRKGGTTAVYPHIVLDRAKPGSICVDQQGKRFTNEAVSYHQFVRAMYGAGQAVPCWMICTRKFITRYGLGLIRPRTPSLRRYIRNGYLIKAATLAGLADQLDLPADTLKRTVARFNTFAATGTDEDFGRGETIYDRSNGDIAHGPNPCLGALDNGPFFAVKLEPTPLGTSRGLAADAQARVLREDGEVLPGLYTCGNDMQSAFAGEYPGAGGQLAQAMTFGWIAARHAAGRNMT